MDIRAEIRNAFIVFNDRSALPVIWRPLPLPNVLYRRMDYTVTSQRAGFAVNLVSRWIKSTRTCAPNLPFPRPLAGQRRDDPPLRQRVLLRGPTLFHWRSVPIYGSIGFPMDFLSLAHLPLLQHCVVMYPAPRTQIRAGSTGEHGSHDLIRQLLGYTEDVVRLPSLTTDFVATHRLSQDKREFAGFPPPCFRKSSVDRKCGTHYFY